MRSVWFTLGPLVLSTLALTAHASTITLTETYTGSGNLGSSFSNQLVTITGTGNTNNVQFSSSTDTYTLALSSVTIQVGSGPVDTFTGSIDAFVADNYIAGFEELTPLNENIAAVTGYYDNANPFTGYALDSDITETGVTELPYGANIGTTGGSFNPQTFSFLATFSSNVSPAPTPEPSSLALLATGLLGLGEALHRRVRASQTL